MDFSERLQNICDSYEEIKSQMSQYSHSKDILLLNPYKNSGNIRAKCNFHCHSNNSHDGINTPTVLIDSYKKLGYDLVNLSDHTYLTKLDYNDLFYTMGAEPISDIWDYVLINVNQDNRDSCQSIISSRDTMQYKPLKDICDIVHNNILLEGSLIAIAHPKWMGASQYINADYDFYEIHNGYNREIVFNRVLASGKRCFIIADDDSHSIAYSTAPKTIVLVNSKTKDAILDALKKGQSYCEIGSSAPELNIKVDKNTISVTSNITCDIDFLCGDNGTEVGVIKYTIRGKNATYTVPDNLPYIRVKAYNNKSTSTSSNYTLSQVFWRI